MKSKVCFPGNQAFDQLEKELQMGFRRVGSYVLAYSQEDIKGLEEVRREEKDQQRRVQERSLTAKSTTRCFQNTANGQSPQKWCS